MNTNKPCKGCKDQLEQLRALDFAIQETVLYLDAYPDCREALTYYQKLIAQRKELMESYEENCAPLSIYGNVDHNSWDWVKGPWPWEIDAN